MSEKIKNLLAKLDIENDEHWTADGLPRLDILKDLNGEAISRSDITSAIKGFSRKTPNLEVEEPENTGSGESADAQATSPETTEDTTQASFTQNEEPEIEAEVKLGEYDPELVEQELKNAIDILNKAKKRHARATEAMDMVIKQQEQLQGSRNPAKDIKSYQASQAKQRVEAAQRRQVALAAMSAAKSKF